MANFFDRLLNRQPKSATLAKERLQLVLINDRTSMTAQSLSDLKDDLINVVSRHVEIDRDAVRVEMHKEGRSQRLIANIPLRSSRNR
jgi:cell division topological specificity factor